MRHHPVRTPAFCADGPQPLDLQYDTKLAVGVSERHLYQVLVSDNRDARSGLDACLKSRRYGDTLVVWKLDRLGQNLKHPVITVHDLMECNTGFRVLTGPGANIDMTTARGRLVFGIFGAFAEFERDQTQDRTMAGLPAARAQARIGCRLYTMTPAILHLAQVAMASRDRNVGVPCGELGTSRQTLCRFDDPTGTIRPDGSKLLTRKGELK